MLINQLLGSDFSTDRYPDEPYPNNYVKVVYIIYKKPLLCFFWASLALLAELVILAQLTELAV